MSVIVNNLTNFSAFIWYGRRGAGQHVQLYREHAHAVVKDRQELRPCAQQPGCRPIVVGGVSLAALRNIEKDWKMSLATWEHAGNRFVILFGDRFSNAWS